MARPKLIDSTGLFTVPVVIDTREQRGFDFYGIAPDLIEVPYAFEDMRTDKADGGIPLTVPIVEGTLKSGDYSLKGFESRVAVERKSLADWYGTLGKGRDRFERELERLREYEFAAVVIEASLTEITTQPPRHSELSPKVVYRTLVAWTVRYPIRFIMCDCRRLAEITTFRLLERYLKEIPSTEEIERASARK